MANKHPSDARSIDPLTHARIDDAGRPQNVEATRTDTPPREDTHFLQPKIAGYRQLAQAETDLMNRGKQLEAQFLGYLNMLERAEFAQTSDQVPDKRWVSIARTHIEQATMAAVRSIAKPRPITPEQS